MVQICNYHRRMEPLEELADHVRRLKEMEAQLPALVGRARQAGASWTKIGRALGTEKQSAHRRFRDVPAPVPDPPWRSAGRQSR